jgi:hypothetical protein
MLPVAPWLHAMNIEATLPQRVPQQSLDSHGPGLVRRTVGRTLIALGVAVAGEPAQRTAWAAK